MKDMLECFWGIVTMLTIVAAAWLWCKATPDQCSAECDWAREQMQAISR